MKVLFIHNKYGKYSGEEAVVNAQIELLESQGHEVSTYYRSSEEIERKKLGKVNAFFTAFYNKAVIREIKILLKQKKPDIVHIHNLYPLISPAILPEIKKIGVPIVMTVHNYRLLCPNGLFFTNGKICEKCTGKTKELNCITNNCEGSLFKSTGYALRNFWARVKNHYLDYVDAYLCLTEFQKNKLITNGFSKDKCFVIPNMFNKHIEEVDYDVSNRDYVAFAGRLSPEKGIKLLLEVARKLPHIPFHLAGQMRKGYEKELDFPENTTYRGMLNKDEMASFYTNARLYLHTSICYEGFPMVFPEAMAYKLPIIAPKIGGYHEIAQDGYNGLLFEFNNSQHLSDTIESIWNNSNKLKEFGLNGFNKMKSEYSKESYYKSLVSVYNGFLNTSPK